MLSQLGQQQHLAALLGFGGGGGGGAGPNNNNSGGGGGGGNSQQDSMRQALAAAQLRQQQPQFSQADLLALSRSGALSNLLGGGSGGNSGLGAFGGGGGAGGAGNQGFGGYGGGGGGLASELEGLQRLEELQRRQRLLAATSADNPRGSSLERTLAGMGQEGTAGSPNRPMAHMKPDGAAVGMDGVSGTLKDDLEKTPGSVIVPCRARGMPMDHNFKVCPMALLSFCSC